MSFIGTKQNARRNPKEKKKEDDLFFILREYRVRYIRCEEEIVVSMF